MSDKFFELPKENEPWDVIIVGSGPSSLTAAIYTTRGASSTLIIAGEKWGGQLMLTTEVDNFPGFPNGIMGPQLMQNMREQAERFGAQIIEKNATNIKKDGDLVVVTVEDKEYKAKSAIIATGADTKWLNIPGEQKLIGRGVSSCAPCDAAFFRDKEVIIVGGGDSAMEEALVLTKYASHVFVVHRRSEFKASQAMQQKVLNNSKISVYWDSELIEMNGEIKLESVIIKTKSDSQKTKIEETIIREEDGFSFWEKKIDGVFVAIGHSPATQAFAEIIDLDERGYIKKQEDDEGNFMATNLKGVFVAGDVHDYHYRQAITASAYGCMAAMEVLKYLDKPAPSW